MKLIRHHLGELAGVCSKSQLLCWSSIDNPQCGRKKMKLVTFILWLSTGAVVGWFAGRMASLERRQVHNQTAIMEKPIFSDSKSL